MIDVGRICVKTAGREAGKFCIVVEVLEEGFVTVTGPLAVTHVKRRRCNIDHLEPTPEVIKIKKGASDDEIIGIYKHEGIFKKLGSEPPSEKELEAAREKERKRASEKKKPKPKPAEQPPEEKKPEHRAEKKEKHEKKPEHKEKAPKKKPEHKEKAPKKKPEKHASKKKPEKAPKKKAKKPKHK
ncbi:MAG: 50S ribosomal protein L14e [Candidatus Aenigmarchaeota archaeon]|nr:50S ribosomal protein L14e [Candidatus Aenigmarchaeota archaeon]